MKHKITATILAGALALTSLVGLTACKGVSMPKGDQVSEEQWTAALLEFDKLENYTLKSSMDVTSKVSGTIKRSGKEVRVSGKGSIESSGTVFYDEAGNKAYSESTYKMSASGEEDGEKEESNSKEVSKEYYESSEEGKYWRVRYSLTDSKGKDSDEKWDTHRESLWDAYETSSFMSKLSISDSFYETKDEDSQRKSISELYEKFTYSGGIYSADLYRQVNISQGSDIGSFYDKVPCTVKVSIDAKSGSIIGLSIQCKGEGTVSDESRGYNITYTYSGKSVYAVSDIGKTNVSGKRSKDIEKAINKAKAEKESNSAN